MQLLLQPVWCVAGKGTIVCVLHIEDGVVWYFRHCLQPVDIKQATIEPMHMETPTAAGMM